MFASTRPTVRRRALAAVGTAAALALTLAACGSSDNDSSSMPGMDHGAKPSESVSAKASPSMGDMPGMDHTADGNGLSDTKDGYRLTSKDATLMAGKEAAYRFAVTGPDGKPVTAFAVDQTKRMHFYAIRSDLTGFQHLHPTMAADSTWTADLAAVAPGSWRLFASFTPDSGAGKGSAFVLSHTVTVRGKATKTPLPAAAKTAEVDGYTVTVKGELMAGMAHPMTVTVTKDGKPVTDLQPYLDTYAHLTAFHEGDTAFAHLHPQTKVNGDHGGPDLSFDVELPTSGNWRLFLQFQTGGKLHTAALTLNVG
nr:FixH family protein [Streptomyces sp. NBC_00830]